MRISAEEALRHPYLSQFHNPADEPECGRIITIPINDNTRYTIQEYRETLYAEIVSRKKVQPVFISNKDTLLI
jgi:mitogen-activated protein kinase 15